MKALRAAVVLFGLAIMVAMTGSPAKADDFNKLTIFTFSQPVEIPGGKVLPAGTYSFKVLDSVRDRYVVQIFNKDQTQVYATVLAIPDYRRQVGDHAVIKFSETPSGGPEAVKEWFYPGETAGWEFVYPQSRATELAKASHQPVPSMPSNLNSNISQTAKTSTAPSVMAMKNAPLKAEQSSGNEVEVAQAFNTQPPSGAAANNSASASNSATQGQSANTNANTSTNANTNTSTANTSTQTAKTNRTAATNHQLPKTASELPVTALAGVLIVALGALLGIAAKLMA